MLEMGSHYKNKVEEEADQKFLDSLSPPKRFLYKLVYSIFMLVGGLVAFYSTIGWWLIKLFSF